MGLSFQVGPTEMAGALKEMLLAAKLPVNLETAQLIQRALILQDELETKTSTLTSVQKVAMLLCCLVTSLEGLF